MTDHPITPPRELAAAWVAEIYGDPAIPLHPITLQLVARAAQWGAGQELEACIDVLSDQWQWDTLSQCTGWKEFRDKSKNILRAARRPKPLSLKEQACKLLECYGTSGVKLTADQCNTIREALEALPE